MARAGWENLSDDYRDRLERGGISREDYESGESLSHARGHGSTPEHIGQGREQERFADYYERREEYERHARELVERHYVGDPNYDSHGTAGDAISDISMSELESAYGYDELEDWVDDMGGWDEVDDAWSYYH